MVLMAPMRQRDPRKEAWRQTVKRAFGEMRQVDVAEATGISQPWINQIANGRIPSWERLVQLCEGLELRGEVRIELFRLAGYVDPHAEEWDADTAFMDGIRYAAAEKGGYIMVSTGELPLKDASVEEVAEALRSIRRREGLAPDCCQPS